MIADTATAACMVADFGGDSMSAMTVAFDTRRSARPLQPDTAGPFEASGRLEPGTILPTATLDVHRQRVMLSTDDPLRIPVYLTADSDSI